jgi:dienelactone hydrolase
MRLTVLLILAFGLAAGEPWTGSLAAGPEIHRDLDLPLPDGTLAAVRIHHPAQGAGPWPVVIFSHGLGGSRSSYGFLAQRWSAHGYLVIQPNHPGSDTDAFRGKPRADLTANLRRATTDPAILAGRPALIARLIDALPALEQAMPALAGKVDRTRIGVGGHSFGAWTTMCVAGMRQGMRGDHADTRPIAFAALSPTGPSALQTAADWAACRRPLLVMTGSNDRQPAFLTPPGEERAGAWRRKVYDHLPAGDKLLAWFDGGIHSTYSGGASAMLMGGDRPDATQVEAVAVITLAWWDAHLRKDVRAQAWLADPTTPAVLGTWARFERK